MCASGSTVDALVASGVFAGAGGGFLSTCDDMTAFGAALLAAADGQPNPLRLSSTSVQQLWTAAHLTSGESTRYGLGWGLTRHATVGAVAAHSGTHDTMCDFVCSFVFPVPVFVSV